jgi:type I restriction enzyme R subunit
VHDAGVEKNPLDEIVRAFNERWFQGWDATPEEQRVRFVNLAKKIKEHPDYESKYLHNPDSQNRKLAYEKIFNEVMNQQRRQELDLYRLISQDEAFKQAMQATVRQILEMAG